MYVAACVYYTGYGLRKVCKDKEYNLYAQNENDSADISSIFKINKSTNVQDMYIVCVCVC